MQSKVEERSEISWRQAFKWTYNKKLSTEEVGLKGETLVSKKEGFMSKLRVLLAVLACGLVMSVTPNVSFAQDQKEPECLLKKLCLTAGYKLWMAKWQVPTFSSTGQVLQSTSKTVAFGGPSVTASYKLPGLTIGKDNLLFHQVYVNWTYLVQEGWEFAPNGTATPGLSQSNRNARQDSTITAGINVWEGVGVFVGYYDNEQQFGGTLSNGTAVTREVKALKGPLVGIFASEPMSDYVTLYGNVAIASLKFETASAVSTSNNVQGYTAEAGLKFTTAKPLFNLFKPDFQLGFRAQLINAKFGTGLTTPNGTNANDITWGPIIAINARF